MDRVMTGICDLSSLILAYNFDVLQKVRKSMAEISIQFLGKNNLGILAPMAAILP
jgi:hypothetical protein